MSDLKVRPPNGGDGAVNLALRGAYSLALVDGSKDPPLRAAGRDLKTPTTGFMICLFRAVSLVEHLAE